jgi:hypothetical protein
MRSRRNLPIYRTVLESLGYIAKQADFEHIAVSRVAEIRVTLMFARELLRHMNAENEPSDAVVCEACGKRFESERELERHVRAVGLVD